MDNDVGRPLGTENPLASAFLSRAEASGWVMTIFEAAPLAVSLRDNGMRLIWANEAYERLLGRSMEEMVGTEVLQLLPADEHAEADSLMRQFNVDHQQVLLEATPYQRPDGSTVIADVSIHPLYAEDGSCIFLLSFLDDVTDRVALDRLRALDDLVADTSACFVDVTPKTLEEALEFSLLQLGNFFDLSHVALFETPPQADRPHLSVLWSASPDSFDERSVATEVMNAGDGSLATTSHNELGSLVILPIVRGDRTMEVLVLCGTSAREWHEQDFSALQSISGLIAGLRARIEAEIYFAVAFDGAPVGISLRDKNSMLLAANQAYADFLGYNSPQQMIGEEARRVVYQDEVNKANAIPELIRRQGVVQIERMAFTRQDGSAAFGRVHAKAVAGLPGGDGLVLSHVEDITKSTVNEKALEQSQRRFRNLIENSPAITLLLSAELDVTYVSPTITQTGLRPEELAGHNLRKLAPELTGDLVTELDAVLHEHQTRHFDWSLELGDKERWYHVSAVPNRDVDGEITDIIMVAVDDSDRRRSQAQLEYQARHDSLTGLANRSTLMSYLDLKLDAESNRASNFALFFLDIDRFKVVNDSLGHAAGDDLIRQVAERLINAVRPDSLVARLGGDEFVIVVNRLDDEEQAIRVANRIRETLAPPIVVGEHELFVTASIGIAIPDSGDIEELMAHADAAMYQAKDSGRNRAELYRPGLQKLPAERIRTEAELRRALPHGEFEVYYQPEVDLMSGRVVGAEALLRWNHPTRGLLPAAQFIAITEECGLIGEIGDWVLDQACEVAGHWQQDARSKDLVMRVNLSAFQLSRRDIVDRVVRAIDLGGATAGGICLEITETVLMADAAASLEILQQFRDLGVSLAVDDFGTGYSSLSYLKRLPVDILKIDQSFVSGLPNDQDDLAIVRSIISLATALGLELIAEGVETTEQREALIALGCRRAQGYLFWRPSQVSTLESAIYDHS